MITRDWHRELDAISLLTGESRKPWGLDVSDFIRPHRPKGQENKLIIWDLLPGPEELAIVGYASTHGDSCAERLGIHQRLDLYLKDMADRCKVDTYEASEVWVARWFIDMARRLWNDPFGFPASLEHRVPKGDGRFRPVGDPAEFKRLVALYIRYRVESRIETSPGLILDCQMGGRPRKWLDEAIKEQWICKRPGASPRDHLAVLAQQAMHEGYGWCLLTDLTNAFGLLPKVAVFKQLRAAKVSKAAAEFIWRAARLDEVSATTRKRLKYDKRMGVSQGNPLSAMLMNIGLAPILAAVQRSVDVRVLAYLDDIYVLTRSRDDAKRAFEVLKREAKARAFRNIRPLRQPPGDDPKAKRSDIVKVTNDNPLVILQGYRVSPGYIGMTDKATKLVNQEIELRGHTGPMTPNLVRKFSGQMALTRKGIRATSSFLPRAQVDSNDPPLVVEHTSVQEDSSLVAQGTLVETPEGEPTLSQGDGVQVDVGLVPQTPDSLAHLGDGAHPPLGMDGPLGVGTFGPLVELGFIIRDLIEVSTRRAPDQSPPGQQQGQASETGVTPGSRKSAGGDAQGGGQFRARARSDHPRPLRVQDDEVARLLRDHRPLRFGDKFKNTAADLRGLDRVLRPDGPPIHDDQLAAAVQAILKVVRDKGKAKVIIDRREAWTGLNGNILGGPQDPAYEVVLRSEYLLDDGGWAMTLRGRGKLSKSVAPTKKVTKPPGADVLISKVRRSRDAHGKWEVLARVRGQRTRWVSVPGRTVRAGGVAVSVARVMQEHTGMTVAVAFHPEIAGLVIKQDHGKGKRIDRPGLVPLRQAKDALLRGWAWKEHGDWLLACPIRPLPGSNPHVRPDGARRR